MSARRYSLQARAPFDRGGALRWCSSGLVYRPCGVPGYDADHR